MTVVTTWHRDGGYSVAVDSVSIKTDLGWMEFPFDPPAKLGAGEECVLVLVSASSPEDARDRTAAFIQEFVTEYRRSRHEGGGL